MRKLIRALMARMAHWKTPVGLFLVFLVLPNESVALSILGDAQISIFHPGRVTRVYTNVFRCSVADPGYSIQVLKPNPQAPGLLSFDTLFDGTNTYLYSRFDTNAPVRKVAILHQGTPFYRELKNPRLPKNGANMEVVAGSQPGIKDPTTMLVWAAYCSKAYYKAHPRPLQDPLFFLGVAYCRANVQFRTEVSFCQHRPSFLERLVQYDNGREYYIKNGIVSSALRQDEFRAGFTNCVFEVTRWTNVNDIRFPQQFSMIRYAPRGDSSGALEPAIILRASVQTIDDSLEPTSAFIPVVQPKVMVRDLRPSVARGNRPFNYFSESGQIETPENLKGRRDYENFLAATPVPNSGPNAISVCIIIAILVLPLIPAAILYRRKGIKP